MEDKMTTRSQRPDDDAARKRGGNRGGNTPNPIELQRALKGVDYPATREQLLDKARQAGADDSITGALEQIPDREYEDPAQVSEAVGRL
jgi:hypothetical protein